MLVAGLVPQGVRVNTSLLASDKLQVKDSLQDGREHWGSVRNRNKSITHVLQLQAREARAALARVV